MVKFSLGAGVSLNIRKAGVVLAGVIAVLFLCLPLSAQVNTGRISGAVTDQTGGAIAGARVTVTEVATGVARALVRASRKSRTFGVATGTPDVIQGGGYSYSGGPRSMQLGLKIFF